MRIFPWFRQGMVLKAKILVLFFGFVPIMSEAQVNYDTSGNAAFVTLSPNAAGNIVIASSYNGFPVTSIGDNAFFGCTSLTGASIPDSVTNIGVAAFSGTGLTNVTIPNNVASIGDLAFSPCFGLTNAVVGTNVTILGNGAFSFCTNLANIIIPGSVTNIGDVAFDGCSGLTNITFLGNAPALDGADVFDNVGSGATVYYYSGTSGWGTTYGGLPTVELGTPSGQVNYGFDGTNAYVTNSPNAAGNIVIASNYNGHAVTYIAGQAFEYCTNLTGVVIPDSVKALGGETFIGCAHLTNVILGSGITGIADATFANCSNLTSVTIPNNATNIGVDAFQQCVGLTNVVIPNSVVSINDGAFFYCTALETITIPKGVTNISSFGFNQCERLTNISVAADNPAYSSLAGVLFDKNRTSLVHFPGGRFGSYVIPNGVTNVGDNAFLHCLGITDVLLPATVVSIGFQGFSLCGNLTNITFLGNAPTVGSGNEFLGEPPSARVYYYAGTTGWGTIFGGAPNLGGLPTVQLSAPASPPQIGGAGGNVRVQSGDFTFTITAASGQTVIIEASTNLVSWQPVWTNTLSGTNTTFTDAQWTSYPRRFYRAR